MCYLLDRNLTARPTHCNTKFWTRENIANETFSNERNSILDPIQDIPVSIISSKASVIMRFSQFS
jgi:hypothetical protein